MVELLAKATKTNWQARCDAAKYLLEMEKDMPQAMALIEESIKIIQMPQNLFVKAQILHWAGRSTESLQVLDQAIELAIKHKSAPSVIKPMEGVRSEWQSARVRR
jgi:tetratricopeptide (TPR) repeat protein